MICLCSPSPDAEACERMMKFSAGKSTRHLGWKNKCGFFSAFFCSLEHSALANWLLLYAVQAWLLVQHSPLYFGSLFISNYFQHFLKRAANSAQGRLEARTASLSLQQTGLAATWRVTSKTQHPTDCQQVPWQRCDPRPCYLKALNVRTAGLHSAHSTSNCTADRITRYYIPAGWIIHAIKTLSSQLNEQLHTGCMKPPQDGAHAHTCTKNVH